MSIFKQLIMGLVVTALFFLGVEGILRLVYDQDAFYFSWEKPDGLIVLQESGSVYARASSQGKIVDGPFQWTYTTNSEGFRESKEIPFEKPKGTLRILALGDSWMFGLNANQDKTMASQLEALLPQRMNNTPIEVINAGVPGACAFDMLKFYRHITTRYEVDGILLSSPHNRERELVLKQDRTAWYGSVRTPPFVNNYIYLFLRKFYAPFAMPQFNSSEHKEVDRMAEEDLISLVSDARSKSLPVWLALVPTTWDEVREGMWLDPRPIVKSLAPYGVMFTGHRLTNRSCWGWTDLRHPSEAGYRVLAELLTEIIATGSSHPEFAVTPKCQGTSEAGPGISGYPPAEGQAALP